MKRMDRWDMACESMVVGIGGVGPWVMGCARLCGFYWVVVGLLIAIVDVDGLVRWICGDVGCFFFFFF